MITDVSHWQGKIDWRRVAKSGVTDCFIKATNGAFNTDNQFPANVRGAEANGINWGAYHFLLSSQDPESQADNFLDVISKAGFGDLLPVLDVEWDMKNNRDRWRDVPPEARVAMVGRFCSRIREELSLLPIIYTSSAWWRPMIGDNLSYKPKNGPAVRFGDCPLWIASYTPSIPTLPAAWKGWALWQFTAKGHVDGINGDVDVNRANVPMDSLLQKVEK